MCLCHYALSCIEKKFRNMENLNYMMQVVLMWVNFMTWKHLFKCSPVRLVGLSVVVRLAGDKVGLNYNFFSWKRLRNVSLGQDGVTKLRFKELRIKGGWMRVSDRCSKDKGEWSLERRIYISFPSFTNAIKASVIRWWQVIHFVAVLWSSALPLKSEKTPQVGKM